VLDGIDEAEAVVTYRSEDGSEVELRWSWQQQGGSGRVPSVCTHVLGPFGSGRNTIAAEESVLLSEDEQASHVEVVLVVRPCGEGEQGEAAEVAAAQEASTDAAHGEL
jgi:hypothetical protein